jgi:HD-GYP domain-containing protein (c-di-GMP phosphodiesterase class II)
MEGENEMLKVSRNESIVRDYMQLLPKEQVQHSVHVGKYVEILEKIIHSGNLCPREMETVEYKLFGDAAYYHDIGKAWVPNDILLKPGKLTEKEIQIIHMHPLFAEQIFDQVNSSATSGMPQKLIHLARESALYHHEWWNGKGYPYGLSKEEIPFIARVTSVCDVYDAITSDRVYRKAHSHEFACHEIEISAGIQLDPVLAKAFLDNNSQFLI